MAQLLRLSQVCRMTRTPALNLTPIPQIEVQRTRRTPTWQRRSDKVFFSSQPLLLLQLPLILLRILPQPMLVEGRDPRHHLEVSQVLQALSQHQSALSAGIASTHPRESTSVSTGTLSVMIAGWLISRQLDFDLYFYSNSQHPSHTGPSCRSAVSAAPTLPAAPPAWNSSLGIFTKGLENTLCSMFEANFMQKYIIYILPSHETPTHLYIQQVAVY